MSLPLIYASVPRIKCKGKCQASCGPIYASDLERKLFTENTGHPFPMPADVLASKDCTCPRLNAVGQCDSYQVRPLICRLWGVVQGMRCPHGCEADRIMTDREAAELLHQAEGL